MKAREGMQEYARDVMWIRERVQRCPRGTVRVRENGEGTAQFSAQTVLKDAGVQGCGAGHVEMWHRSRGKYNSSDQGGCVGV